MGGNLFKLGRIPRKEYIDIEHKISTYLKNVIGEDKFSIPRYFKSKEDFGDLDIIIDYNIGNNSDFISNFKKDLNVTEHKRVNRILSNIIDNFQVDLFLTDKNLIKPLSSFMDYNIGNFIGKIAKRFNMKYGEKGLYYVYRRENSDHYVSEYKITDDKFEIFTFLGLDYGQWEKGFETNYHAFEWIISSKYFSSYTYLKPNASIKDRVEFTRFVEYLVLNNITKDWNSKSLSDSEKISLINNHFNINLNKYIEKEIEKERINKIITSKFNGEIVMKFTGYKGKELGEFIRNFKTIIGKGDIKKFNNKILNMTDEQVVDCIVLCYIQYEKAKAVV